MNLPKQLSAALAGRYEVEREIGAGGMAVVYLARDLKHDRRVALKVLRPELGAVLGAERFLSEIKVTANLQHPNLLPLFDSGEADGQLFYVMPYVEGESLRKRLDRDKQLPVDTALHIATAVASALDYAHRQGVIHRDLKPENILLHDGEPLVADFGIALAVSNAGAGRVTQTGLSLGTPQYMSPEQATGDRNVDGRADIYSLAAVTYEMLVGEPPHIGHTSQAIIARVLTERPRAVRVTRPNVPEHVDRAIAQALEKLPADRFETARELADALAGKVVVGRTTEAVDVTTRSSRSGRREKALAAGLMASLALWLMTIAGNSLFGGTPDDREVRFHIPLVGGGAPHQIAVSPDGAFVVFGGGQGSGAAMLWIRALADTVARPLPGTTTGWPFWSPDSRYIGYSNGSRLEKVGVEGGPPQRIADLPDISRGAAWNDDGLILVSAGGKLYTVPEAGGTPIPLPTTGTVPMDARFPVFLPDGRHFLFLAWSGAPAERAIYAGSVDGGAVSVVVPAEGKPVFIPPETLLFRRQQTLFAQRFDRRSLTVSGEAVPVAEDVLFNAVNGANSYAASSSGVLIFRAGGLSLVPRSLQWYARDGAARGAAGEAGVYSQASLSPDDRQVALARRDPSTGGGDIWILDLESNIQSRLTFEASIAEDPIWFPNSREVGFNSTRAGALNLYRRNLGANTDKPILESSEAKSPEDVSRDGRFLLYRRGRGSVLEALPLTHEGEPVVLSDSTSSKDEARFSPDGRWVSYGSIESGSWEVYVAPFPAFDTHKQVSRGGGVQARWRGDGRELFYLGSDGAVMSVAVRGDADFAAPTALFQSPLENPDPLTDEFNVTGNGQRFLFLVPQDAEAELAPITVVLNWRPPVGP